MSLPVLINRRLRSFITLGLVAIAMLAVIVLLNIGGWKTRIRARLFRTGNWPVVVAAAGKLSAAGSSWIQGFGFCQRL